MHINAAMFETTGRSGYVLKPPMMWDTTHEHFNRFNPFEKEFATPVSLLTIHVCSALMLGCK
jgi:hypothetical protein